MKIKSKHKDVLLELICFLFTALFLYAAISKFLIFKEFKIPIANPNMLTTFMDILACCLPFFEILIALLLIIPRYRLLGLYAAFTLMVLFATYITIILNFSDDITCSCGGLLSKLNWSAHFILNIVFIILAFIGVMLINSKKKYNFEKYVTV